MKDKAHTLICTVGTSLTASNLARLPLDEAGFDRWLGSPFMPPGDRPHLTWPRIQAIREAYRGGDDDRVAHLLAELPSQTRLLGAEINSTADLVQRGAVAADCRVILCHSETEAGARASGLIQRMLELEGHSVTPEVIEGLQDTDPRLFRTRGLRNLARVMGSVVLERGARWCAINATGGYKAQIAIATLLGQALGLCVYYKHERFDDIIAVPPMPVSLDLRLAMAHSGVLEALDRHGELPVDPEIEAHWDERLESLVDREDIDGQVWLALSPVGQIFVQSFRGIFRSGKEQFLPPEVPVGQKQPLHLTDHNWGNARARIVRFGQRLVDEVPFVASCQTHYWNKSLSTASLARLWQDTIQVVLSNGTWTVKYRVETSAQTDGQREACVADLNQRMKVWLG